MPQGLQVFDAAGRTIVDTSTLIPKRILDIPVSSAGSTTIPIPPGARVAVTTVSSGATFPPAASVSGQTLSWGSQKNNSFEGRVAVELY